MMQEHLIETEDDLVDVSDRYSPTATIPGPTLIIDEGDEVFLTLQNNLVDIPDGCVSVHVHGVHYFPSSDGTSSNINGQVDSCATVDDEEGDAEEHEYQFQWSAGKGTAGTWPYHDHTLGGDLGAELEGLYGTLIVNPKNVKAQIDGDIKSLPVDKIDKEIVLWMQGTSFWGMEIDHKNDGKQTPLWLNPNIKALLGDNVRFHVIGIGSEFHSFHIHGHRWLEDGTTNIIDVKNIGPLSRSVFVLQAGEGVGPGNWMYHCHVFSHMQAGMTGIFTVTEDEDNQTSMPGPDPFSTVSFEITDEPGPWFKNRAPIPVADVTESLALAKPGDTILFDMTDTNTVHTITSLIYPVDSAGGDDAFNMPFDQSEAFSGGANVQLIDEGLYVFTCKIHPYMFGGVIVDEDGLDDGALELGKNIRIVNGIEVPTHSALAVALLKSFFVVTLDSNWQYYEDGQWNVSFPAVPVRVWDAAEVATELPLSALNPAVPPTLAESLPITPGVGEVWIDTQFEITQGKDKYGSATALDTTSWDVIKKYAQPTINMNHPHNMWTDLTQERIYQTQWFDNRMAVFDRADGGNLVDLNVGESPSHVMTRPDANQDIYIAINGANSNASVERYTSALSPQPTVDIGAPHPHGHWMNEDVMVTPNAFTDSTTAHEFGTGTNTIKDPTALGVGIPIATGMHPSGEKYYVANLLDQTVTCVSIGSAACETDGAPVDVKPIVLIQNWNPVTGDFDDDDGDGNIAVGLLPIQTPVSPDGSYVVTATLFPSITIIDTLTDELVLSIPCDAGCHGVNFGAKDGGGYYAYVSSKFSNAVIVFDPAEALAADGDSNGQLEGAELSVIYKVRLDTGNAPGADIDDVILDLDGMGGQGVLAIPNPYDGWIEKTSLACSSGDINGPFTECSAEVNTWLTDLTPSQRDPYNP
jgi:plastocyanin